MDKPKDFRGMLIQALVAMAAGFGIGLVMYSLNLANISFVFAIAILGCIWDIICQLQLRDTASKKVLTEVWKGLGVLIIFVWLRNWLGWMLDFPITGVQQLAGQKMVGWRGSDAMLELYFLVPGALMAWAVVYATEKDKERYQKWFVRATIAALVMVFVSYRVPAVPEALKALGYNLRYITNLGSEVGLKGSTEQIELAKDISVIYLASDQRLTEIKQAYDGHDPSDAQTRLSIRAKFAAGQRILKLAGTRVLDDTILQEVRITGPDGKFVGGQIYLVDRNDIVAKQSPNATPSSTATAAATGSSTGPGWFSRQWTRFWQFCGWTAGNAVWAYSGGPKRLPTSATITFDPDPTKLVDTGLRTEIGDTVRYSGVQKPFETSEGNKIQTDVTCDTLKGGVIRVKGGKGTVKIEVFPK